MYTVKKKNAALVYILQAQVKSAKAGKPPKQNKQLNNDEQKKKCKACQKHDRVNLL